MASLGSSIRSAAQATFSAYRAVPVRWRLAGGSAALTCVILAGFAAVAGVLTDRQLQDSFTAQMQASIQKLQNQIDPVSQGAKTVCGAALWEFDSSLDPQIRLFDPSTGDVLCSQALGNKPINTPTLNPPLDQPGGQAAYQENGYAVQAQYITWKPKPFNSGWLIYARPLSEIDQTMSKVRVILGLGVLGGSIFALLAGLYVAQRAMRPIVELTDAARDIERTRDPTLRIPRPEADDEIAELARTLEGMLGALSDARAETEAALARQREFVADASHELRTPLTSVLANLELLADELDGEQADSAKSALRSTRRMRRLVGDLLLLARADAQRESQHRPTDLGEILTDAAGELGPVAEDHDLTVFPGRAVIDGNPDDLHRVALNLLENALRHTPPGTAIRARSGIEDGAPVLVVEDEGPGIPPELQRRVFDRFVRGGGDTGAGGRGTGLGLAIVRAVADAHGATVMLGSQNASDPAHPGTRFEISFPPGLAVAPTGEPELEPEAAVPSEATQTSTTTGNTIGRRRSRS
jgi:two-component system, OmpR family, sensor kinase